VNICQMCLLEKEHLGYAETLETHHIDNNSQNNERSNLQIVCTSCHKLIHHQRTYRYNHYVRRIDNGK
jgi:5-methylcytosine-specific restriction endonuclease McrA